MSTTPRVSILIPNYNNGRESSLNGTFDLIANLLESLRATLEEDPTPVEIIAVDDGSTDDSLETLRAWSARTWDQGGRTRVPFLRLIERPHCGVLSEVANVLMEESVGEFCCRLDGDIVIHTPSWATRLCEAFDGAPENVGVIGPKQLAPDGTIHSAGDWLIHPLGYHHIAQGAPGSAITASMEVDHVMGCFYCMRRSVWNSVGPYDTTILRGQTIDYTVAARMAGWTVWFIPNIEFTHFHGDRVTRANKADTEEGIRTTIDRFEEKWGFNRLAPDLELIREKHAGTPLVWNARLFGPRGTTSVSTTPVTLETSRWTSYQSNPQLQKVIDTQAHIVAKVVELGPQHTRVVQYGCGDGLLAHFLSQAGMSVTGLDADEHNVALARDVTARSTYRSASPRFEVLASPDTNPLEDDAADIFLLIDQIERHWNPVGLLKQAERVLRPGGKLVVFSKGLTGAFDSQDGGRVLFRPYLLRNLIQFGTSFSVLPTKVSAGEDVVLMIAENGKAPAASTEPVVAAAEEVGAAGA